jgi:hypothetical protein
MKKSIAQIKLELHKATGGALPIGPPADIAAKLAALKEQMRQQGQDFNRRMQGVVNAEKTSGQGVVLPTDKAKGGVAHLAIGGQGPRNWMKGVEDVIYPLKSSHETPEQIAEAEELLQKILAMKEPGLEGEIYRLRTALQQARDPHNIAINQWVDRNLGNYIRKQMATPGDPIRKLAEEGITHMPPEMMGTGQYLAYGLETPYKHRAKHGGERLAKSDAAKAWEDASDVALGKTTVGDVLRLGGIGGSKHVEPWMEKADPKTEVFHPTDNMHAHYLGFDHLVDILKQDMREGRIRPDQLNKVSIEHAVRRAHEHDQEQKRKMEEAKLKAEESMPVHKDYGDGYKWRELSLNPELPEGYKQTPAGTYIDSQGNESIHHPNYGALEDALKYEGDTMGHCVGGYTPDVVAGKSRIYSLRDAKNEPHVTVEVKPNNHLDYNDWYGQQPTAFKALINAKKSDPNYDRYAEPAYLKARSEQPPVIKQIKGKGNAKPVKQYIPYVQDFVKSGNWSHVDDIKNADMIKHKGGYMTHAEHDDWLLNQLKPDQKAHGGIIYKAEGGSMDTPDLAQSRLQTGQRMNPALMDNIGINEALDMSPKTFINPEPRMGNTLPVGGVEKVGGLPIGGVDQSSASGMQFAPQALQQPQQDAGAPQGGLPPSAGASSPAQQPPSNILSLTPQGRALGAMAPQGMAKGGIAKQRAEIKFKLDQLAKGGQPKKANKPYDEIGQDKRVLFKGEGYGNVKGIVVPRHMWEGNKASGNKKIFGMDEINKARAKVYGEENRDPLHIGQVGRLHKQVLADHFAKPLQEQLVAEKNALARLREAKHIGKNADTLDKSEKLDTVNHEYDDEGRSYKGFASKGVAGSSLYTSGHGDNRKFHIINTCPGQTVGCGGGHDEHGIVDTMRGTCFAPNAESQYAAAAVRRASHEQAKHDPAMTTDWILAHTGSLRDAARVADKQNRRLLFRPNVVDETDVSSRHVLRHLNEQRAKEKLPPITANSYGKTNELHDPENGYYVTHSNIGPKVKQGQSIQENIGKDKARVRNTIMAADNKGDFVNEQGHKTPPKGSYMVTDVKRGSQLGRDMAKHLTHAKYWTTGRSANELTEEEKAEPEEAHYGPKGDLTTPDKAHYGHTTLSGKRFDYQKQHILHPRLVQVGHNDDGTPHMIPTDSRFKDEDFLPKNRFMTKNGKKAGHILMTTPTESTSTLGAQTSFTHHVGPEHLEHAKKNKGEYEIDSPAEQIKAEGKEYVAPQPVQILKKTKKFALGGVVVGDSDDGLNDDDFHAFPERNFAAQHHLANRMGVEGVNELHPYQLHNYEAK